MKYSPFRLSALKSVLLLSPALLLLSTSQGRADLIVNGSFESFVLGAHDTGFGTFARFFAPPANTDLTGWTLTGSSGGNPNNVDLVSNANYAAFDGTFSLDMEGEAGSSGVIEQSFATTPGETYNLSYEYGNNPAGTSASMNTLVTGTGVLLNQNVSHTTSTVGNMDYTLFSSDFVADSSSATLQFAATTNTGFGIVLDAVSVEGVASTPEPASLALLVGVLTSAGLVLRRRKR